MSKDGLFKSVYNKANMINMKSDLDIYDECEFSYLDILKEKEVEVVSKAYKDCKCVSSVNFNTYYNKCEKCEGKGKIILNGNQVVCNHCKGEGKVTKEICPLCNGEGKLVKLGKVKVKLNKNLKDNDIIAIKGKGKESNDIKGDLFIKVMISDKECFEIVNNDVYDKRMIEFSKEDLNKGISKEIETVKGFCKVKSNGGEVHEVVKLEGEGISGGDYYICLYNELTPLKGKDVYKNVIINREMLGFYIDRDELYKDMKCLNVYYYKKLNINNYIYIDLEDANNFKIVKLKEKGINGKNGGTKGDLYLRIYFDDEFVCMDDKVYHKPINLTKNEVNDGKKVLGFDKNKIVLNFPKNLEEEYKVKVDDYGFMVDKNEFDSAYFVINPFEYNNYKVSVKVGKKDKLIYLKDYKKYFNEEVKFNYSEGLKVNLNKKNDYVIVSDDEGNKVKVNVIR